MGLTRGYLRSAESGGTLSYPLTLSMASGVQASLTLSIYASYLDQPKNFALDSLQSTIYYEVKYPRYSSALGQWGWL